MAHPRPAVEYVLSDEQLDALADRLSVKVAEAAAHRAKELMYADFGKAALAKIVAIIGFLSLCLLAFLAGKNALNPHS